MSPTSGGEALDEHGNLWDSMSLSNREYKAHVPDAASLGAVPSRRMKGRTAATSATIRMSTDRARL